MYKCLSYISCEDGKFFKGAVYDRLPKNPKYHSLFVEVQQRKEVEVSGEKVETASMEPPKRKRGRKPKK